MKVARAQNRIRNQRNDYINNVVADILKKGYETICMENLSIKDGMLQDKNMVSTTSKRVLVTR